MVNLQSTMPPCVAAPGLSSRAILGKPRCAPRQINREMGIRSRRRLCGILRFLALSSQNKSPIPWRYSLGSTGRFGGSNDPLGTSQGRYEFARSKERDSAVLLLPETSDLLDVDGVELGLAVLLVGRELFLVQRLESDSSVVSDAHHEDAAALLPALVVLLIREGDVNLGNVVRGVGRRVGVHQHGLGVALDDDDAGSAKVAHVARRDGETAVVAGPLDVGVVLREDLGPHLLLPPHSPQQEEDGAQQEADEDETEDGDHQADDRAVRGQVAGDEALDRVHDD